MPDAHAFAMEQMRRSVQRCTSVDEMRQLTLRAIDLMETQRQVFLQMMRSPTRL